MSTPAYVALHLLRERGKAEEGERVEKRVKSQVRRWEVGITVGLAIVKVRESVVA